MSRVDFKVVLLGKSGAGKTCLARRYTDGSFHAIEATTVGAAYFSKRCDIGNRSATLGIWDTAGQERFDSMTKVYYRGAQAAVICYDVTGTGSFERAKFWVDQLMTNLETPCRIYLVGTKVDLINEGNERIVSPEEISEFAEDISASLSIETSAKSGAEVETLFQKITEDWLNDHPQEGEEDHEKGQTSLEPDHGASPQPCDC